jgi:hypothetical protein
MSGFTKALNDKRHGGKLLPRARALRKSKSLKGPVPAEYLMAVLLQEENKWLAR